MNKIKQKFLEFKQAPKRVQWLLLGVAFVVVLILLTMLMGKDKTRDITKKESVIPELKFSPANNFNWADVTVGDTKKQDITVTSNVPVNIVDVRRHESVPGFEIKDNCKKIRRIDKEIGCTITVSYTPTSQSESVTIPLYIDWYDADKTEDMKDTGQVDFTLGALTPVKPEPVVTPKPIVIPEPEPIPEPMPVKQQIMREVETIAPPLEPVYVEPEPEENPEACSDFAFPGYDNSGVQIGWIKPERGAYYFHPFSDKDCSEPTGVYNPDNGIITDINKRGKRIGSDADHIGYNVISTGEIPQLSNRPETTLAHSAKQNDAKSGSITALGAGRLGKNGFVELGSGIQEMEEDKIYGTTGTAVASTQPYDRSFVLRQFKPIPATIVSDVRADIKLLQSKGALPVRATVDRNVYSDNGRTVIIPTGTLLMGYVTGEIPGPYKAIGRMEIQWYQFILPNGVEFNFTEGQDPFSADAQGRVGVPGRGSTDYMEQFLMPMLTAFVPATINMIAPISDAFVNQIDLDNNTVVQSGTVRSSELAKNEIITAWNSVAQKLMVDMMDNTVPPFTIPAGTRITVYSPVDLQVTCTTNDKCNLSKQNGQAQGNNRRRDWGSSVKNTVKASDNAEEWIGQARSWAAASNEQFCERDEKTGLWRVQEKCSGYKSGELNSCGGYSYSTLKLYCESLNYESKKEHQWTAYQQDQSAQYQQRIEDLGGKGSQQFNEEILGIQYNDDGTVKNPYGSSSSSTQEIAVEEAVMTCLDGSMPDANGCCAGEIYTDMGEQGFNCCPEGGGDCFPPMI